MVRVAIAKGRDLPQWYVDEPLLLPTSEFFLNAFADLSTERQMGMGLGPIPWSVTQLYAERKQLDPQMTEAFVTVIRTMDAAYLDWHAQEAEKQRQRERKRTSR